MRGATLPLPHTSSWRGTWLPLPLSFTQNLNKLINYYYFSSVLY